MRPVLLFNMSVIVFFVGSRAGKLDALSLAITPEVVVDKLRPIVYREKTKRSHNRIPNPIK